MTIATTSITPLIYVGTGTTDTYVYNFTIYRAADLVVERVTIATSAKITLTLDAETNGYEVEVDENGDFTGNIILSDGNLPITQKLVVYPQFAMDQEADYTSFGPLPAETHEKGLDKLTLICQQIQEQVDRCLKVSIESGDEATSDNLISQINDALNAALAAQSGAETAETNAELAETNAEAAQAAAEAAQAAAEAAQAALDLPDLESGDQTKLLTVKATYDGYELLTRAALNTALGFPTLESGNEEKLLTVNATYDGYDLIARSVLSEQSLGNCVFSCSVGVEQNQTETGEYMGTDKTPEGATGEYQFSMSRNADYTTVKRAYFRKIAGINTVRVYAQIWQSKAGDSEKAKLQVDIGGQTASVDGTVNQVTPEWKYCDVDVSGLNDDTDYEVQIQIYSSGENVATHVAYLGSFIGFGLST